MPESTSLLIVAGVQAMFRLSVSQVKLEMSVY